MAASSSLWIAWVPQMKRTLDRPEAPPLEPVLGGADQARDRRQAEVVVGAEVQDLAPADGDRALPAGPR